MRIAVFLVYLIFMLPAGNVNVFAGTLPASSFSKTVNNKTEILKPGINSQEYTTYSGLPQEDRWLYCEEVDDEDANEPSQRKYKSLASPLSIPFYQPAFKHHHIKAWGLPIFWHYTSNRYILQRALKV